MAILRLNKSALAIAVIFALSEACPSRPITSHKDQRTRDISPSKAVPAITLAAEQQRPGEPSIRLELANDGNEPVELRRADLPWFQRTLFSVAVSVTQRQPLRLGFELDTAPPGSIRLDPRTAIYENVDLSRWFPDIPAVLQRDDVVFLWKYDCRTTVPQSRSTIYGGVTLKRRE